jgi:hypothetical protein
MKKLVKISDASEEQLLLAACDYVQAQSSMIGAVRDKFGDFNADRLAKGIRMTILDSFLTSIETELDQTREQIDGDTAHLVTDDPNDDEPIALIREDGIWKIHTTGMTAKWTQEQFHPAPRQLQQASTGLGGFAEEIKSASTPASTSSCRRCGRHSAKSARALSFPAAGATYHVREPWTIGNCSNNSAPGARSRLSPSWCADTRASSTRPVAVGSGMRTWRRMSLRRCSSCWRGVRRREAARLRWPDGSIGRRCTPATMRSAPSRSASITCARRRRDAGACFTCFAV